MKEMIFTLYIFSFFALACNSGNVYSEKNKDAKNAPQNVSEPIDFSKKSDFHYYANGEAAPDYNKSINDFKATVGSDVVDRTFFMGEESNTIVTEIYNKKTGDFIGFSGDTSKLNWQKLDGQHLSEKIKKLIIKFGPEDAYLINKGKVEIGMTADEAIESWGRPNDINKTISGSGIHEQWVYDNSCLYFDNGKLTTIQN